MTAKQKTETMLVFVCECCALLIANNDETACRDHYEHGHIECDLDPGAVVTGEQVETPGPCTCDGCHRQLDALAMMYQVSAPTE